MKKNIICVALALFSLSSCNDDFLEYTPKTSLTEENAFVSYDNFKTYAWGLYGIFSDGIQKQSLKNGNGPMTAEGDAQANYLYMSNSTNTQSNNWQWNNITSSMATDDSWNFAYIRRVNIMLRNIDNSSLSETDKNHWRAVGYFFRAYRYFDLMARYGDVPWLETVVSDQDTDILYGKRTSRDEVARNILENLKYAEENIKIDGEGKNTNTINRDCVRALMSRFCLFEGTWRKFHGLTDSETYLNECERVSKLLMGSYPEIGKNYVDLWSSDNLAGYPGVILYKQFETDLIMSSNPRADRGGSKFAMHARTIGRYLCQDGKPIGTSSMYKGKGEKATMNDEFYNRDHRLYWRCIPPYRTSKGSAVLVTPENELSWWDWDASVTPDPKDRYFIDYMNKINDHNHQFPLRTWQPHFLSRSPMIQTSRFSWGPMRNYGGYYFYIFYSTYNEPGIAGGGTKAVSDMPIFHIEEVMLNYAEVMNELGKFDQSVADQTINRLRARANVKPMVVAEINESFDPDRDKKVEPLAWEIRRERMVELMGEGFGFYDIRRWKRADYFMNQRPLGVRVAENEKDLYFGPGSIFVSEKDINADAFVSKDDIGRVVCVGDFVKQGLGWKDYMYLNPIPKNQLVLNPNLKQNPGWD